MAVFYTWAFQNSLFSKSRFNSWEKHILSCACKDYTLEVRNPGATGIREAGKLHILCSVSAWTINRPKQTGLGVERKPRKAYVFICETERRRGEREDYEQDGETESSPLSAEVLVCLYQRYLFNF